VKHMECIVGNAATSENVDDGEIMFLYTFPHSLDSYLSLASYIASYSSDYNS
jgi:hypothetical protein